MAVKRPARKTTATKPVQKFALAEVNSMTIVELRELAKGLGLTEQKMKNGIRAELFAKGYVDRSASESPAPAAAKTPRRASASQKVEEPQDDDEMSDEDMDVLTAQVVELIKGGAFDAVIESLDEAIGARIDFAIAEQAKKTAAAKRAPAAKKTAPARKTAPPVRRKVDADDEMEAAQKVAPKSASAPAAKPVAKKGPRMVKGVEYTLKGTKNEALTEFVRFAKNKDTDEVDRTRAVVKLLEDYGTRKEGAMVTVPVAALSLPPTE